ncbi:MAG: YeeE/YedE family protein [Hyphomicrobiaceae bacterium]
MDLTFFIDRLGDAGTALAIGLGIGILFGAFAQRSRFCLRAATIEFSRGAFGTRLAVWLYVFAGAVVGTQVLLMLGLIDTQSIRMLNSRGSVSGAILGGVMFGTGMVLARGCSSRLLVLAANGNLRSLLSGLVFAVTAQASLKGALSPIRDWLAQLWTIDAASASVVSLIGIGQKTGLAVALVWLAAALYFGIRSRISPWGWMGGLGVGLTIMLAWFLTFSLAQQAFTPTPVKSMTFTGPSASTLMLFLSPPGSYLDFDTGLVPGVFIGSLIAALAYREWKLEGFEGGPAMRRYLAGAVLMGFGGMLAGGCAVGSVSGASVFALTAWLTLFSMFVAAGVTDYLLDRPRAEPAPAPQPSAVPAE